MFKIVYEGGNTKALLVGVAGQPTQTLAPGNDLEVSDEQIEAGVSVSFAANTPAVDSGSSSEASDPAKGDATVEGAEPPAQPEVEQGTANG